MKKISEISIYFVLGVAGTSLMACDPANQQYVAPQAVMPSFTPGPDCIPPSPTPSPSTSTTPSPSPTVCTGPFCGGGPIGAIEILPTTTRAGLTLRAACPVAAPALLTYDGSITYFGLDSVNSHNERTFTVLNLGQSTATALNSSSLTGAYSFFGGSYPGSGGTCGVELAAGQSCTLIVDFFPQAVQEYSGVLNLSYFDSQNTQLLTTQITGIGVAYPTLSFANPTLSFGSLVLGTNSTQTVTVQYSGTYPATGIAAQALGNGFSFAGGSYPGTGGTCGAQISANCTIVLTATPATAGADSYTLNLDYDNGAFAASASLGLSVVGVSTPTPAVLTVTPPTTAPNGNFGNQVVGTVNSQVFIITNTGTMPAGTVSAVAFKNGQTGAFSFTGGTYPGNGGTCRAQITAPCLVSIDYAPTAQSPTSDQLSLTYTNGATTQTQTLVYPISGNGVIPAQLAWSPAGVYNFGTQSLNTTTTASFTLTNTSHTVAASGVQFAGTTQGFSVATTSCTSSLAPGASCTVSIAFTPTAVQGYADEISVVYSNGYATVSTPQELSGQGTDAALLTFTPSTTNFGSVVVGSSVSNTFTINYFGAQPASQIIWSSINGPNYFYDGGTCSNIINGACTVAIKFLPEATGPVNTPIQLLYFDGYQTQTLSLPAQALGITAATLSFSTGAITNLGTDSVDATSQQTITVTNSGTDAASGVSLAAITAPFTVKSNTCGATLAGGANCAITVSFTPTAAQSYSQTLTLNYQNGLSLTSISTTLEGAGSSDPTLGGGGGTGGSGNGTTSYNFGSVLVGKTKTAALTITYTGINPASIQSVTGLSGPDFFYDVGSSFPGSGSCGANQISATCTFGVLFQPSQTGARSTTVSIIYNNGAGNQTLIFNLSGTGLQPATVTASASGVDAFAVTPLNYKRAQSITLTNSGSSQTTAALTSLSAIAAPFSYVGGTCFGTSGTAPVTLAIGASCTITLGFQPTAAVSSSQGITVTYSNGVSPQTLALSATGTGTSASLITLENGSGFNFGSVMEGSTGTTQITVQYYGATPVSVQSLAVAAPFAITEGNCGDTITANCALTATFNPTAATASSATLTVTYQNGSGQNLTATAGLSGTGKSEAVIAAAPTLSFSPILIGASEHQNLTLTQSGSVSATQLALSGLTAPFSLSNGNCGTTLSGACTLTITFAPTQSGTFSQTLTVSYNNGSATVNTTVAVSGSAQVAPALTSTTLGTNWTSFAFGGNQTVFYSIQNTGTDVASSITFTAPAGGVGFALVQNGCSSTLAIGQSCTVSVRFTPKMPGTLSDSFSATYTGSAVGSYTLSQALVASSTVPVQLATKGNHTCVINTSGQVECWGEDDYGQTGPSQKQVIPLGTGHYAKAVATGFFHTCAILENASLKCWGRNDSGQLGQGDSLNRGLSLNDLGDNLQPVSLGTGHTVKAVSLGYAHTCAILDDNSVKCWGINLQGQLGQGDTVTRGLLPTDMGDNLLAVSLGTGLTVVSLDSSVGHNCVILSNQALKCWGDNFYGELGLGDGKNRGDQAGEMGDALTAISLPSGMLPLQVSTGGGFTCLTSTSGVLSCWGLNYNGTLGTCYAANAQGQVGSCFNSAYTNYVQGYGLISGEMGANLPSVDLGLAESGVPVTGVSSGTAFSCVTSSSGVKCFGDNTQGELGAGDLTNAGDEPNEMGSNLATLNFGTTAALTNLVAGSYHACALFQDGTVRCWGDNAQGQLGMSLSETTWGGAPNQMGIELPAVSF